MEDESGRQVQREFAGTESKSETEALLRRAGRHAGYYTDGLYRLWYALCRRYVTARPGTASYPTLDEIDRLAGDEALKKSIQQYTIHVDDIIVPVYRREMEAPIEDMKRFLDGLLHIFDKGRTRVDTVYLYNILHDAQVRLNAANDSVAP